jgi:hypothetical protein
MKDSYFEEIRGDFVCNIRLFVLNLMMSAKLCMIGSHPSLSEAVYGNSRVVTIGLLMLAWQLKDPR